MPTAPEDPKPTRGALIATPFAIATVVAARGAVLAKLWAWFVVPLGAVHVSWLHACGIALTWQAVAQRTDSTPGGEQLTAHRVARGAGVSVGLLLITFGVAAVVAAVR